MTDDSDGTCVVCGDRSAELICRACQSLIGAKPLFVEDGVMDGKKPVLHPTDFSEGAEAAFAAALDVARRDGAELILVHALQRVSVFQDETYIATRLDGREADETAARKGFDRLLERAKTTGVRASDVLVEGWPPAAIVKTAEERHVDLIVMGTHGHTGMRTVLLGSVAERVIATAPCPVLTVRM